MIELNSDASTTPETARALHRVVRAMHDGNCPNCGHLAHVDAFRVLEFHGSETETGWEFEKYECPKCQFSISPKEAQAAMGAFRPYMQANVGLFEEWRAQFANQTPAPNSTSDIKVKSGPKSGVELIADERARQVSQEGWDPAHDDEHKFGELSKAAEAYLNAMESIPHGEHNGVPDGVVLQPRRLSIPSNWPWSKDWWKPSEDPVRNLAKAGALIAAEIDRLNRMKEKNTSEKAASSTT